MATYVPPKRATAYRFTLSLFARADNQIRITPTLAAGDVKVSKDNGATANITTLPSEAPASSGILQVDLSATEMTADLVTVIFRDAAGAEWNDAAVHIATAARQIDDLATPTNITAGTITTVTNLTNAPTSGDLTATMKTSVTTAATAATPVAASVTGAVGSVAGLTAANLDATISSRASAASLATAQTSIDDLPTNAELATSQAAADDATLAAIAALNNLSAAELATALGTADDAVLAQVALVKAKTDNLPSDPADQSLIIFATDALATLIGDVPTNAELATALGTADDAVLAALSALGLTNVAARLTDVWQILGLDSGNAMTVTPTSRAAGTIAQTISGDGTTTSTVTRTA